MGLLLKLSLAGSSLIGLGALLRYLGHQSGPSSPTQYDLGLASDYPVGSRTVIADAQALLIHTQEGFSAFSLVCPHLGCLVNVTNDGFACPCHGSRFLLDGSLRNGPASRGLTLLRVEESTDGQLTLYTS